MAVQLTNANLWTVEHTLTVDELNETWQLGQYKITIKQLFNIRRGFFMDIIVIILVEVMSYLRLDHHGCRLLQNQICVRNSLDGNSIQCLEQKCSISPLTQGIFP